MAFLQDAARSHPRGRASPITIIHAPPHNHPLLIEVGGDLARVSWYDELDVADVAGQRDGDEAEFEALEVR